MDMALGSSVVLRIVCCHYVPFLSAAFNVFLTLIWMVDILYVSRLEAIIYEAVFVIIVL